MHCDCEAIAAYTNYDTGQMSPSFHQSIDGLMDSALDSHLGVRVQFPAGSLMKLVQNFLTFFL